MDPVNAADCRLLLSLLKYAIVPPDQLERLEAWLRAKEAALTAMETQEKELRELANTPVDHSKDRTGDTVPGMPGAIYC